eukprot:scaffold89537_cov22-Tisochrysis_lutea.AAC.1
MRNRTHEFCYEKSVMPCHERLEIEKRRKIIHLGLVMCKGPKNEQNRGAGKSGMPDSQVEDVSNYAEVREKIAAILTSLRDTPNSIVLTSHAAAPLRQAFLVHHPNPTEAHANIIT